MKFIKFLNKKKRLVNSNNWPFKIDHAQCMLNDFWITDRWSQNYEG